MTDENGEFDIIEDFGYLLMNKAYEKTSVKLFDDENEMEIEEWTNYLNLFPYEETNVILNLLTHVVNVSLNEDYQMLKY